MRENIKIGKKKKGYVTSGPTHGVLFLKNAPLKCIILP